MKTADYYTATWCGPCKQFKPIILELISEGYNITIHDVDVEHELAQSAGVRSIPVLVISDGGTEVERLIGVQSKDVVKSKLA